MPQQVATSVTNNFTKGLITEATGLNFPENACTKCDNTVFTLIGDVTRREGIDFEINNLKNFIGDRTNNATSTYKWNNVGGDGSTQMLVVQNGPTVEFFNITNSTETSPLSNNKAAFALNMSTYTVTVFDRTVENQYADGNGYLFIYNLNCVPIFVSYSNGTFTTQGITVQIRDLNGIAEQGLSYTARPTTLSAEHNYNLFNQGWSQSAPWSAISFTANSFGVPPGTHLSWDIGTSALPISPGDVVNASTLESSYPYSGTMGFTVTSYSGTVLSGNIISSTYSPASPFTWAAWYFNPISTGNITTWHTAVNNYPSNSDIWWLYKNSSGVFDPSTTYQNVSISLGPAPKGHYIFDAFNQQKSATSGIAGLTPVITNLRPTTGTWFAGRVWYAGVNASQPASGDSIFYSWTENIYFSQVALDQTQFGLCYQANDPTSQTAFDLLSTDGGVIQIQGCGGVYKLFPTQNGLLVFAANGVWFITGSQGIGFSATDYTITKISAVESLASHSFVDVLGLPYFWNEEGIYQVMVSQNGSLAVEPITVGTILSFYANIPKQSKKYVRGAYDPINYIIQWVYKSVNEVSVEDRYNFDSILNYNTFNKAFYPYSINNTVASINSINYVQGPGGSNSPDPVFKYLSSLVINGTWYFAFADEHDETYADWASTGTPINYISFFETGYRVRGQGIYKEQPQYLQMWIRTNDAYSGYKVQGIWDYANSGNSGRFSSLQNISINTFNYDVIRKRHKIRGHGYAYQFYVQSQDGFPFDVIGWSVVDTVNAGA